MEDREEIVKNLLGTRYDFFNPSKCLLFRLKSVYIDLMYYKRFISCKASLEYYEKSVNDLNDILLKECKFFFEKYHKDRIAEFDSDVDKILHAAVRRPVVETVEETVVETVEES